MTSRWMLGVQGRERAFRKRRGNESLTEREKKFYRPKMNERPETHILRMMTEASKESALPTEWWRYLARVLQVIEGPLHTDERSIINRKRKEGKPPAEAEEAILRYRRLTGYIPHKPFMFREDELMSLLLDFTDPSIMPITFNR